ncbi:hypothetical protein BJ978_001066 [Agromyces terreus]|uniref:Alpha/beta hydrolase n=1 Tax=Agromyces terreus TaxID=424795 RepID=A0A9X2KBQ3_9MICO|nr:hypothetical protein [Agromyces terreus]MCP2370390.1 hypothetical protein [Agromyces terreus]
MSDDLIISGGGTTSVAVDSLFVDAGRLGAAATSVQGWIDRFEAIRSRLGDAVTSGSCGAVPLGSFGAVPTGSFGAAPGVASVGPAAGTALGEAHDLLESMRTRLLEAAERYGATERCVGALWDIGGRIGAVALGLLTTGVVIRTVGGAVVAAPHVAVAVGITRLLGLEPRPGDLPLVQWLTEHRDLLSDPSFVRLVRTVADHADDYALATAFGTAAIGIASAIDASESASGLLGLAGLASAAVGGRLLTDGPVKVERVAPERNPTDAAPPNGRFPVPAPTGLGDLAQRVPPSDGRAQITIERYDVDGENRWIAYVGGTVDFTLEAGSESSDMTSNLHSVAQSSPLDDLRVFGADSGAADRAVRAALAAAGADPADPVLAIGHSGGGVVVAGLASDPELNVVAGVSLGGPVASAPIQPGVPFLSVEHVEDLVPATGGSGGAGGRALDMLVVSREVLDAGHGSAEALPAHRLTRYRETAERFDASEAEQLVAFRATVADFTGGATGERTRWRASRE